MSWNQLISNEKFDDIISRILMDGDEVIPAGWIGIVETKQIVDICKDIHEIDVYVSILEGTSGRWIQFVGPIPKDNDPFFEN